MSDPALRPVPVSGRISLLDGLRGFALIGVVVSNMPSLSGLPFTVLPQLPLAQADRWVQPVHQTLVDGKFYTLFSLLFGVGFALMLGRRTERMATGHSGFFIFRLFILFLIGLVHALVFYPGDILTLYAVVGVALVAFGHARDRTVLVASLVLLAVPPLQYAIRTGLAAGHPSGPLLDPDDPQLRKVVFDIMTHGSWTQVTLLNAQAFVGFGAAGELARGAPFKVLGTFLMGMYAGRRGLLARPLDHLPLLRRVALGGCGVGLPVSILWTYLKATDPTPGPHALGLLESVLYAVGSQTLALGYAALFALLWVRPGLHPALAKLVPLGRMALTNYLTQSVVAAFVFRAYGLGLWGHFSTTLAMLLGLAELMAQGVLARVWLRSYRFGPAEWLWRSLAYRQLQPMRRAQASESSAELLR